MKENHVLNMTYHSYWKDEENNFDVQPYCVKLFRQRWYMVARSTYSYYYEKGPRIYSLDRIKYLHATEDTFKMPNDWTAENFLLKVELWTKIEGEDAIFFVSLNLFL